MRLRALSGLTILLALGVCVILCSWFYRKTFEKRNVPIERLLILNAVGEPHGSSGINNPARTSSSSLENQLSRYAGFGYLFYMDGLNRVLRPLVGYEWAGQEIYNGKITLLLREQQAVFLSETEDGEGGWSQTRGVGFGGCIRRTSVSMRTCPSFSGARGKSRSR